MRSAAALAVLLFAFAGCASDDGTASTTLGSHLAVPGHTMPDDLGQLLVEDEGLEVVDLADFRALHDSGHSGVTIPPDCGSLAPSSLQRIADENLACGNCYAVLCDGELYAHMCTHQCDGTVDPDYDTSVPVQMK